MKKEMVEELTMSIGETIPLLFHRMDFLQLVQSICHRLDSDPKRIGIEVYAKPGDMRKVADRFLAEAQMIPLHLIPIDSGEELGTPGLMYLFTLALCKYWYGVADGTIDGSNWGLKYYNENASSIDANLAKYLQYASRLSETGGW